VAKLAAELASRNQKEAAAEAERLKQQGEFEKLAQQREAEAAQYRQRYEQATVRAALTAAANASADPGLVAQLLSGRAQVDDQGRVTVDGQPAEKAVAQLLKDKPFLARPMTGGGSPAAGASAGGVNPWKKESLNLTEQARLLRADPATAARLKAEAGLKP